MDPGELSCCALKKSICSDIEPVKYITFIYSRSEEQLRWCRIKLLSID